MTGIKKFENLECWKKARELCKFIFQICKKIREKKNYHLADQMLSSSGSVMDNISEGFLRGGNKEFCHFLSYLVDLEVKYNRNSTGHLIQSIFLTMNSSMVIT